MDQLYFSDASLDDLDKIVAIYNSTISSRMVTADLEPVSVESRIAWFHEHQPGKRPLWTVKNKEEVIGWVSFQNFYGRPAYNATAEISIYLHPLQRGKGFGKLVLDHSMDECKNLGIKTLLGYIFAHNAPSLGLFLKAGFTEWAHLPDIANLDGIERSLKILGKRIYR
jgi:L-amino acid N-acyltransferase YncA